MYFIKYEGNLNKLNGKNVRVKFYNSNVQPDPRQFDICGFDDYTPETHEGIFQKIISKKNIPQYLKFKKKISRKFHSFIKESGLPDDFLNVEILTNHVYCIPFNRITSIEILINKKYISIYS